MSEPTLGELLKNAGASSTIVRFVCDLLDIPPSTNLENIVVLQEGEAIVALKDGISLLSGCVLVRRYMP